MTAASFLKQLHLRSCGLVVLSRGGLLDDVDCVEDAETRIAAGLAARRDDSGGSSDGDGDSDARGTIDEAPVRVWFGGAGVFVARPRPLFARQQLETRLIKEREKERVGMRMWETRFVLLCLPPCLLCLCRPQAFICRRLCSMSLSPQATVLCHHHSALNHQHNKPGFARSVECQ